MSLRIVFLSTLAILFCVTNAFPQSAPADAVDKPSNEVVTNQSRLTPPETDSGDAHEPVIGGGDLLKISVFGVSAFDQEVRVSAKGIISLPLIGDIRVAGLSVGEAQSLIREKLIDGNFMLHPEVSVFQTEYASEGVSVLGEVQKPGVYPMLGVHRLFDVLSLAGGMTPKAGPTVTVTHRDEPGQPQEVTLGGDVAKSSAANIDIQPGDTVVVSKAAVVYVVGDVKNPMGVVMDHGNDMTVLKAIAMAGGTNSTAALNSGKIIRCSAQGPQEMPLALKKILSAKAPDPKLQAEDIIFVPTSAAKVAGKRGLEAIVQAATGVAIYRPY